MGQIGSGKAGDGRGRKSQAGTVQIRFGNVGARQIRLIDSGTAQRASRNLLPAIAQKPEIAAVTFETGGQSDK